MRSDAAVRRATWLSVINAHDEHGDGPTEEPAKAPTPMATGPPTKELTPPLTNEPGGPPGEGTNADDYIAQ